MDNFDKNHIPNDDYECQGTNFIMINDTPVEESDDFHKKRERQPMNISKGTFALILILCMILTSALSIGGFYTMNRLGILGSGSAGNKATNYTLTSSEETLSYESIIQKNEKAVVSITTEGVSTDSWARNYVTEGAGSGVIIDSNGYILTCNHVISGASKITVTTSDEKEYSASVVGTDSANDIAVLKISASGLTAATYGDSSKLAVGSSVVAIGNPLGELGGTATTGIISALNRELTIDNKKLNLLQTDASINPGNSGGGLFDAAGNLIGIVVAKSSGSNIEGLGFAIPINTAAEIAKDLIENGSHQSNNNSKSTSAVIGITVAELDSNTAKQYGLTEAGVYISQVTGTEATNAGFKTKDLIYSIGKTTIENTEDLAEALAKHDVGEKIKVIVIRDGEKVSITTTLVAAQS